MKYLNALILAMGVVGCTQAQTSLPTAPPWNATVKVVDETDEPVAGANVEISYYVEPAPNQHEASEKINGLTDAKGVFRASHQDTRSISLGFHVTKAGYYSTTRGYDLYLPGQFDEQKIAENRNPNLVLLLKKVGQPIPMYAKQLNTHVPALDKPIGFDLMNGDWMAPYGKGINADILFTGHFDKHTNGESDYTLTVNFQNPGDGIREFNVPLLVQEAVEGMSDLRSPHEAPPDDYQPQWVQTDNRKPGKPVETNRDSHRNYFFRVRTVLDEKGNVKSTFYGKIFGDFMQFKYYLNPTPNDRNVEFDPKQNLLHGLKPTEEVNDP